MSDCLPISPSLTKLAPFILRARLLEVGRERLAQVSHKLAFLLLTEDISVTSRRQILAAFPCPVFQCLKSADIARIFGYNGTRLLGFRRSPLSAKIMQELKMCRISLKPLPDGKFMPRRPRVAVLGASGIGRHHISWWQLEGAEVCAFLGRTQESIAATKPRLLNGTFSGNTYTCLEELLDREKPDIVDVCLPPELHFAACRTALAAGSHVLCEKPFVYDENLSRQTMLEQAQQLTALAQEKQRLLGVCTQYAVAANFCLTYCPPPPGGLSSYQGRLVSPGRNRARGARQTWIDLAPHLLAALQVAAPEGQIDWQTLETDFAEQKADAQFVLRRKRGKRDLTCRIQTLHADTEPFNVRQLTFDDQVFDIAGKPDENGIFQLEISTPRGMVSRPDMLRQVIRSFSLGKAEVSGAMAVKNMQWLLEILSRAC
jgi:hypothetical protein